MTTKRRLCTLAIALLALPALGACAQTTPPVPEPTPVNPMPRPEGPRPLPGAQCDTQAYERFVGETANETVLAEIRTLHGDHPLRVLAPGTAATMDYRTDRLNVVVDADKVITALRCG